MTTNPKRVIVYHLNYGAETEAEVKGKLDRLMCVAQGRYGVRQMQVLTETTTNHFDQWALAGIINKAKKREIDVLVVWSLEGLSCRVPMHTLDMLYMFISNGVEIFIESEQRSIGRGCEDTLVLPLLDWVMEYGKRRGTMLAKNVHIQIHRKGGKGGRHAIPIDVDDAIMRHNRRHESYAAIARSLGISRVMLWQRIKKRNAEKEAEKLERRLAS